MPKSDEKFRALPRCVMPLRTGTTMPAALAKAPKVKMRTTAARSRRLA